MLSCGVSQGLPGFSSPDDKGNWTGLDVDVCRALAAAIFNDPTKVKFVPLSAKDRFTALQSGEIDVLSRNTTWTLSRDTSLGANFTGVTYYDGQGFLVKKSLKVNSALELNSASVCVQTGTTTEQNLADYFKSNNMKYEVIAFAAADETVKAYESGRCDVFTSDVSQLYAERLKLANPADHAVLPGSDLEGAARPDGAPWRRPVVRSREVDAVCDGRRRGTRHYPEERRRHGQVGQAGAEARVRHRRQSRRTARPHQGLGVADRQGGRQLRRSRSTATSAPARSSGSPAGSTSSGTRAEFSTRRRSADRRPSGRGDEHRAPTTAPQFALQLEARARRPRRLERICLPDPVRRRCWSGSATRSSPMPAPIWQAQRITSGFGFLTNTAGFDVSQSLIPYSGSDTYTRVFLVGLLNTLLVSVIGIFFATVIGFHGRAGPAVAELAAVAHLPAAMSKLIRNLPLLFQILFWYLAVLARAAQSAAEHLAVRHRLSFQPRSRGSEADRAIPAWSRSRSPLLVAIVSRLAVATAMRAGSCSRAAG